MNSEFLKFVNRQINREVISPRAFALGGMLLILTLLYASHALAADRTPMQEMDLATRTTVAAFHDSTGLMCPNARIWITDVDAAAKFYKVDLRCDLGDVYQHFNVIGLGGHTAVSIGEVEAK
jgi:hypothetical protein